MNKDLKTVYEFIEDHIDLIDNEDFETLYNTSTQDLDILTSTLTNILLSVDIDPLRSLDYVPDYYLWMNPNITTISIPSHIRFICANAFGGTNIKSLVIPGYVKIIGMGAFSRCKLLTDIIIEEGCDALAGYTFASCENIQSLKLPNSIKTLGGNLFRGNDLVVEVEYNGTKNEWDKISKSGDIFLNSNVIVKGMDFELKYNINS